jgi:hypothetical protein
MTWIIPNPPPDNQFDIETLPVRPDLPEHVKLSFGTALLHEHMTVVIRIAATGDSLPLEMRNRMVIGRGETGGLNQAHVDLTPYHGRELGVSRRHAVLYRMKNSLFLDDLGSSNGSYLNGQRLTPGQPRLLRNGDELRLGKFCCYIEFT